MSEAKRGAFAHDALLEMEPTVDIGAPGAAITAELCGHWEHEGPCPLSPHHTHAERGLDGVRLRVLFAADPADEQEVRRRIEAALAAGEWRLVSSAPGRVREDEHAHAGRLARS